MRTIGRRAWLTLIPFAMATNVPSLAASVEYVGVWAIELEHCGEPQVSIKAPMLIAEDHYDHYTTHCTFKAVEPSGNAFAITADCTDNDQVEKRKFALTVSGDTLTFTDESGARDMLRCE